MMIISYSFIFIGTVAIVFGLIFAVRQRARIFYGKFVDGPAAIFCGVLLIVVGAAIIAFGTLVLPSLIDWPSLQKELYGLR